MSYRLEFDPANQILVGRFEGKVTDEEITEFYRVAVPKAVAATRFLGSIVDFSDVSSFDVTSETMRALAWSRPADPDSSRLRVIVAPAAKVFGLARMFALHGEDTRPNLHVVRSLQDAYVLFGVVNPQFDPLEQSDLT
jgi:hypothetical protein